MLHEWHLQPLKLGIISKGNSTVLPKKMAVFRSRERGELKERKKGVGKSSDRETGKKM